MIEGGEGSRHRLLRPRHGRGRGGRPRRGTAQGGYIGSDRLAGIENLEGSRWDDRLAGDGGANALAGGQGADALEGRGGADRFVYGQDYDSRPAAADRILDFSRKQGDRIDLSAVDANDRGPGNPAFQFVGQGSLRPPGRSGSSSGRRHGGRGQHHRRDRRRGAADRARPGGEPPGHRLRPVAGWFGL